MNLEFWTHLNNNLDEEREKCPHQPQHRHSSSDVNAHMKDLDRHLNAFSSFRASFIGFAGTGLLSPTISLLQPRFRKTLQHLAIDPVVDSGYNRLAKFHPTSKRLS